MKNGSWEGPYDGPPPVYGPKRSTKVWLYRGSGEGLLLKVILDPLNNHFRAFNQIVPPKCRLYYIDEDLQLNKLVV